MIIIRFFSGILKRLEDSHGLKVSLLLNELHSLEKDLESIQTSEDFMLAQRDGPNDKIEFLINHPRIKENLENFIAKPFKKTIEVYPYDLPREMNKLRDIRTQRQNLVGKIK